MTYYEMVDAYKDDRVECYTADGDILSMVCYPDDSGVTMENDDGEFFFPASRYKEIVRAL